MCKKCCKYDPHDLKSCHQCLRWSMFATNLLLFCVAAVMMGIAVYMINAKWETLANDDNVIPVIMFIAFAIIMLVTTIGALGACNLSRGFLIAFICITIICIILEITLVTYVSVTNFNTEDFLVSRWDDLSNGDKEFLESEFNCCGLYDGDACTYDDDSTDDTTATTSTPTTSSTEGCLSKLEEWVENIKVILLIIGAVLLLLQIGGAIVSILILRALRNSERLRDDSYIEYSYYENNV